MNRNSLVARTALLSGLVVLAGCSKEIDFSLPATFNVNSAGTPATYNYVQQIDLAAQAPDAWSHKDKVKDLSLVDVEGTVLSMFTPATTGSGTVALRPDGVTNNLSDVTLGTYTNKPISNGASIVITLVPAALTIVNDALQGNGKFQVVASGSTAAAANFTVQVTLHMKLNYKII